MSKNFERVELQGHINEAVASKLKEIGCESSEDHTRRTIRALLHVAGKLALEQGCSTAKFREFAEECIDKEKTSTEPEYKKEVATKVVVSLNASLTNKEKRPMGGYVLTSVANVSSNVPIFSDIDEVGPKRVVRVGSDLDIAIRAYLGKKCINGGSPIYVTAAKSAIDFTIEFTRGYQS